MHKQFNESLQADYDHMYTFVTWCTYTCKWKNICTAEVKSIKNL